MRDEVITISDPGAHDGRAGDSPARSVEIEIAEDSRDDSSSMSRIAHGSRVLQCLSIYAALVVSLGCGAASQQNRIRQLDTQEKTLRASVDELEARQSALTAEIERSRKRAALARCEAEKEAYRAVVARVYAEYALDVANHRSCSAEAAKEGGLLMALGCGLGAVVTGGLGLAICGTALVGGAAMSEGDCRKEPPPMTTELIRQKAYQISGKAKEPSCGGVSSAGQPTFGGLTGSEVRREQDREPPRIMFLSNPGSSRSGTKPTKTQPKRAYRKAERSQRKIERKAAKRRRKAKLR